MWLFFWREHSLVGDVMTLRSIYRTKLLRTSYTEVARNKAESSFHFFEQTSAGRDWRKVLLPLRWLKLLSSWFHLCQLSDHSCKVDVPRTFANGEVCAYGDQLAKKELGSSSFSDANHPRSFFKGNILFLHNNDIVLEEQERLCCAEMSAGILDGAILNMVFLKYPTLCWKYTQNVLKVRSHTSPRNKSLKG